MSIQWSRTCIFYPMPVDQQYDFSPFRMMFSFLKVKLFTSLHIIKCCLPCYMGKFRFTLCSRDVSPSFFRLSEKISVLFLRFFLGSPNFYPFSKSIRILQIFCNCTFTIFSNTFDLLNCSSIVSVGYGLMFLEICLRNSFRHRNQLQITIKVKF